MNTLTQALTQNINPSSSIHFIRNEQEIYNLSYAELRQRASGLLHHLQTSGMEEGHELILLTQRNEAFIEGFWAAVLGGITAVPLAPGISDEHRWKLFRVARQLKQPWILLDQAHLQRLEKFAAANSLTEEWTALQERIFVLEQIPTFTGSGRIAAEDEHRTAFIQFSSGTTSDPKGIVLSHRNLAVNIAGIIRGMKMTAEDSTLSWMPLHHDMGLIGFHLVPLFRGTDQYLMPTESFIRRPLLWLQQMSQLKVTVTCSPNFGYKHCLQGWSHAKSEGLDLSAVRLIFNGAEPISVSLADKFLTTFAAFGLQRGAMFTVYGLAEASLAVAFPEPGVPFRTERLSRSALAPGASIIRDSDGVPFVTEGRAVEGCEIRITADGRVLQADHIGRIEIRGANVTSGYLNREQVGQELFKDGWLDTGDLGFLNTTGELTVTGRAKDIIFVNGQNFYPEDIEQIAEQGLGIEKGKIVACGIREQKDTDDQVIVFVNHKGAAEQFYEQGRALKRLINESAGIQVEEVIPVTKVPKTTSGKIQRYLLASHYLEGEFNEVIRAMRAQEAMLAENTDPMITDHIEQNLKSICDELIPEKSIRPDDNIFENGTTSLHLAQLHQRIEEEYPGKLEITDFFEYPTLRQLAAFIGSKAVSS